jgi:hypothetical protein
VHDHLSHQTAGEEETATLPGPDTVEALLDVCFWASLRREEGYVPRISLAYVAPWQTQRPSLTF